MSEIILYCKKCGVEGNEHFAPSKLKRYKKSGRKSNYCKECQKKVDSESRQLKMSLIEDKIITCRKCGRSGKTELFSNEKYKMAKNYTLCRDCRREKQKQSINYRIRKNISKRIKSAFNRYKNLKKDYGTMKKYVGCDMNTFFKHIEKQFTDGMSWENYGEWHMDHIKPISSFDLTDEEQVKKCFHYTNIQPLWAKENLKKSNKY